MVRVHGRWCYGTTHSRVTSNHEREVEELGLELFKSHWIGWTEV